MPRTIINLPQSFFFETEYKVLFSDLNVANHVGADRFIGIAFETQLRFLTAIGFAPSIKNKLGFITCDYEARYLSEAHYNDELMIQLAVTAIADKSFDLRYKITHKQTERDICHIKTNIACFDYSEKTLIMIPEPLMEKLKQHATLL